MRYSAIAVTLGIVCIPCAKPQTPTFHREVEPILRTRCQTCHRPGEAAPMSLLTYTDVRPWAKSIKAAVLNRKMPPWFADPEVGHFRNDRTLPKSEVDTLVRWVDTGAPEGDTRDAPKPLEFVEGWGVGKPDAVYEMAQPFEVPANGVVDYQWVVIPLGFKDDRWIRAIEVRPGNRQVVHHIGAFLRTRGSRWLSDVPPGITVPKAPGGSEAGMSNGIVGEYVPGLVGKTFPEGTAMLLPAGSDIVMQLHYTTTGRATSDRSKIGLYFAPEPPNQRFLTLGVATSDFTIPPNAPATRVIARTTFGSDVRLLYLQPHMHLRGKSFEFKATYPDGHEEVLLRVPQYDFSWQLRYELAGEKLLPAGTTITATALYDNSANNPRNPNPNVEVRNGEQSTDEMMAGIIHVAIPLDLDMRRLLHRAAAVYESPSKNAR
jgi:hypothetical protein